ncbi:hypothetical protein E0H26_17155 [Micromonospora zingiberis]|uniref:Uncharacterized protein n=1 Tax=Micromonospora zingiberis TaxID=2053011 RepID=A0A4R0GF60_9ACTN|nr:hypothetical protein [Micromonospora zingiberis]TCB95900.1 hypothetical protein E0H26_17155 [Micromonospora zingiberis]
MPPVVPARPLWWLARWAARLLTGFAVAAAFTLGAWALPAHATPTGDVDPAALARQLTAVSSAQPATGAVGPQASHGWAAIQSAGDPQGLSDEGRDPGGWPVPVSPARPQQGADPAITGDDAAHPATATPGVRTARAPPRS